MKQTRLTSIFAAIAILTSTLGIMQSSYAATGSQYNIRVDGLACPFCAYGIEKKFKKMDGISNIKVDLEKGIVSVDAKEGLELGEDKMKALFNDSGFTYRSMEKTPLK